MLQAVLLPVSRLLLRLPHNSDLNMCGRPPSIQATELELSRGCGTPKPVWDVSLFHLGTLKFLKLIFIFRFAQSPAASAPGASPLGSLELPGCYRATPPTGDRARHCFVTRTLLAHHTAMAS